MCEIIHYDQDEPDQDITVQSGELKLYSLTGYTSDGILDEVYLLHETAYHPNEFQSLVINAVGKLRDHDDFETYTVHDVAHYLIDKFDFRRFSFYNCFVWDRERNIICETSIRG